jgi:hypothetical protein
MSEHKFFDGGWCWMSHPSINVGNAVPVSATAKAEPLSSGSLEI